jgi:hypothetical protein
MPNSIAVVFLSSFGQVRRSAPQRNTGCDVDDDHVRHVDRRERLLHRKRPPVACCSPPFGRACTTRRNPTDLQYVSVTEEVATRSAPAQAQHLPSLGFAGQEPAMMPAGDRSRWRPHHASVAIMRILLVTRHIRSIRSNWAVGGRGPGLAVWSVRRGHPEQSTATSRAAQMARIRVSASRPSLLTKTETDTLSTESRFTAERRGIGSESG